MQLVLRHGVAKSLIMGVLGAVAAYVTLALASTLVQEVWLGGVSYQRSESSVLILASVFTPLCAFAGGLVDRSLPGVLAGLLRPSSVDSSQSRRRTLQHQRVDGPLRFEAGAAAALILAACAATWLDERASAHNRLQSDMLAKQP